MKNKKSSKIAKRPKSNHKGKRSAHRDNERLIDEINAASNDLFSKERTISRSETTARKAEQIDEHGGSKETLEMRLSQMQSDLQNVHP